MYGVCQYPLLLMRLAVIGRKAHDASCSVAMRRFAGYNESAACYDGALIRENIRNERKPTMEYEFSDDVKMLRQAIREFAEKEVAPIAREIDEQERVPFETLKKAGELGLMGVPFPEEYGGIDAGIVGYCVLMEELN